MFRLALCLVIGVMLAACVPLSTAAPEEVKDVTFESPLSNQVEAHEEAEGAAHDHTHLDPSLATEEMSVALVPSELVVGANRFAVGLFDGEGQVVHDAEVHFHYYDLSNPDAPVLESHAEATRRQTPDKLTTIFAHERDFDRAGPWGVEVQATFGDGRAAIKRISFEVLADSPSPIPGEVVPSVETAVSSDVGNDLSKLSSALVPNPAFYEQSLVDAIASGKPTVLLFATPAFCQTRFCGPAYDLVSLLQLKYGSMVNFIHVEVYTGLPDPAANNWELAPAMTAFGLRTEPWLYLLDRSGVVVYRVEGLFTPQEIERHLPALLGS